jgi:hypothetical protein
MDTECSLPGCENPVHARYFCHLHYRQMLRATKPKANLCECGCGTPTRHRFVSGHNTRLTPREEQARRGQLNTGAALLDRGAGKTYRKVSQRHEHRTVAEVKLGRALLSGEIVHHINGNKRDNRPENLEVLTRSEHIQAHRAEMVAALRAKRAAK